MNDDKLIVESIKVYDLYKIVFSQLLMKFLQYIKFYKKRGL